MTIQEDFQVATKKARTAMQKLTDMAEEMNIRQEHIDDSIQFIPADISQRLDAFRAAIAEAVASDAAMVQIASTPELQAVAPAAIGMRVDDFSRYERQLRRLEQLTPKA